MRSSEEAGGLKELAKRSMSSRNLVAGMPRSFLPSVMESREMLATGSSWLEPVPAAAAATSDDMAVAFIDEVCDGRLAVVDGAGLLW